MRFAQVFRNLSRRTVHCRGLYLLRLTTAGRFALRASAHWAHASLRRHLGTHFPPMPFTQGRLNCRAICSFHSPSAGRFVLRASAHCAHTSLRPPLGKAAFGRLRPAGSSNPRKPIIHPIPAPTPRPAGPATQAWGGSTDRPKGGRDPPHAEDGPSRKRRGEGRPPAPVVQSSYKQSLRPFGLPVVQSSQKALPCHLLVSLPICGSFCASRKCSATSVVVQSTAVACTCFG